MNSQWYEDFFLNYLFKTIEKLWGMNPLGLSAPRADYPEIIALHPVKTFRGINPMGISAPR